MSQEALRLGGIGMIAGDAQGGLSTAFDDTPHRKEKQWTAGDGFPSALRVGATNKEIPPVVNLRHHPRGDLASVQVFGGEPAPAPLILQFVIGVFHIRPLPVKMQQCQKIFFQVGHQHHVFVEWIALNLHASSFQQGNVTGSLLALNRSPEYDRTTLARPAGKLQLSFASFPALWKLLPATLALQHLNELIHFRGVSLPK